ncbi:WYL domain-containing transcriptional regulator [Saccharopolyspora rhizosphaerae]|uniref:WYL domain-containing transcriptional regulator n=1 Tax=Saccharopolyspora rhizosphaerae TaxID=2492662 RepID=A0A426JYB4_9PSEU|nr:WYL domain-containing protein [Saccharopolyspora rhizosphaerae]RRO18154.1 WYL domain-containing transcriptional regulator [Saccharopolyspora rhizosphaerae]
MSENGAVDTAARLLRLLALLQSRRQWAGHDLAERVEVSARTVRADVQRLRDLGYPVHATSGVGGGYRLGAGAQLPPLLLDDEEAVAVALALRSAGSDAAISALTKLHQVLPSRLGRRVRALQAVSAAVPGPGVDPEVVSEIARACRDHERLRFDHRGRDEAVTSREVEPHRLVSAGRRWYLVGWDLAREDWRTFRVDRMSLRTPGGPRFEPRPPPEGGFTGHVTRGIAEVLWNYRAVVEVHDSAEEIARLVPVAWPVTASGPRSCLVEAGADTPHDLATYLAALDRDFTVVDAPELAASVERLAQRLAGAAARTPARREPPEPGHVG